MALVINSKKDKSSLACKRGYGGIYVNGKFVKDGTVVTKQLSSQMSDVQKCRYVSEKKSAVKKTATKKPTVKKVTPKKTATKKTTSKKSTSKKTR